MVIPAPSMVQFCYLRYLGMLAWKLMFSHITNALPVLNDVFYRYLRQKSYHNMIGFYSGIVSTYNDVESLTMFCCLNKKIIERSHILGKRRSFTWKAYFWNVFLLNIGFFKKSQISLKKQVFNWSLVVKLFEIIFDEVFIQLLRRISAL